MYLKESSEHLIMTQTRWWSIYTLIPCVAMWWNLSEIQIPGFLLNGTASLRTNDSSHAEINMSNHKHIQRFIFRYCFVNAQRVSVSSDSTSAVHFSKVETISPNIWPKQRPKACIRTESLSHRNMSVISMQLHIYNFSFLSKNPPVKHKKCK